MTLTYRTTVLYVTLFLGFVAFQSSSIHAIDLEAVQLTTADLPKGFYLSSKETITEDKTTGKRVRKNWVHEDRVDRLPMATALRALIKKRTEGEIQEGQAKLKLIRTSEGKHVTSECQEYIEKVWHRTRVTAEGTKMFDYVHVRIVTAHPGRDPQDALLGGMDLPDRTKRLDTAIVGEKTIVPERGLRNRMEFVRGNVAVSISVQNLDTDRAGNEKFCLELAKKVDERIIKALEAE